VSIAPVRFQHFQDPATVHALLAEIRARRAGSVADLADALTRQIAAYFARAFGHENPTRFGGVRSGLVRPRALVALSGGIDSTVVLYLAVRALGRDAVLPVTMPARPEDESIALAALVRDRLGFDDPRAPYLIDIEPIVKTHMAAMSTLAEPQLGLGSAHASQSVEQKMRSGNFGSRVRVAVLCDLQRAVRGRILGTVNRTEYCQGYSTKFGTPISYDYGVLNDLYKVDVFALAEALGVPEQIVEMEPSTGYFAGQTHAGELGASLEEQDIFAYLLFEKEMTPEAIAETYGASLPFGRIMRHRFDVSDHKRALNVHQEHARAASTPLRM
jgi:NAD+ synthase